MVGAGFAAYGYAVAQTATVPDVSGLNRAAAEQTLVSSDLELDVVGREHSESVARNAIISMEPAPGSTVTKGTLVSVIVSAGPPFVKVPKVVGESRSRAEQRLTNRQLRFDVREDYSDTVPAGSVISVTPATGERVRIGSAVTVVVSRGPAPVTVPDVVAMDRDSAISRLESLGLRVAVRNQLPLVVVGRVYSQDPAPGTVIPRGSTVTITLV